MANTNDAGQFSLAGFLFQILGTGVEAIEILEPHRDPDAPRNILFVERFGQDSAQSGVGQGPPRLNQYKHTSTNRTLKPGAIRKVLQRMVASVVEMGVPLEDFDFLLTSNMDWSPEAETLWALRDQQDLTDDQRQAQIEDRIRGTSVKPLENVPEMATIFQKLVRKRPMQSEYEEGYQQACANFGMLPDQVQDRIDTVLGLLLRRSADSGRRIVHENEFFKALTGIDAPYELLSGASRKVRLDEIEEARDLEIEDRETSRRPIVQDIISACIEFPVVVVVGPGGSGKTIAAIDAACGICIDDSNPPGFVLLEKAVDLSHICVMNAIGRWRNQRPQQDGNLGESLERLQIAYNDVPCLLLCADGVDEKDGDETLNRRSLKFLKQLIVNAVRSFDETGTWRTGLVITCRDADELDDLLIHKRLIEGETYSVIPVGDFVDVELALVAHELQDESVRTRILASLNDDAPLFRGKKNSNAIHPESLKRIRQPILWGIFANQEAKSQHQFLDGDITPLKRVFEEFLGWFRRKVSKRNPNMEKNSCFTALCATARAMDSPTAVGGKKAGWIDPSVDAGCTEKNARTLFDEAMTAGLITWEEKKNRTWRWNDRLLCEHLAKRDDE